MFASFLLWRSVELIRVILASNQDDLDLSYQLFIAFLINLYVTGVFAFPGFVFPTAKILPSGFYKIHHPSRLKRWYKRLGVKHFRRLLLFLFWQKEKKRKSYFRGTREGLSDFIENTHQSEFGHLGAFCVISLLSLFLAFRGYSILLIMTVSINILVNLYPVILQRYHRYRVERWANASDQSIAV